MSDGTTWFDFLTGVTLSSAEDMLVLCEGAYEAGVTLDENDAQTLDSYLAGLESYAAGEGVAVDEYIAKIFGREVTSEVIRDVYRKSLLADKYYEQLASSVTVSEDECAAYLESNRRSLSKTDYMVYSFAKDDAAGITSEMARDAAMKLSKLSDGDDFFNFIRRCDGDLAPTDKSALTVTGGAYSATDGYCVWAYAQSEAGVTYLQTDEAAGKYTVYLLLRAPYLDEYTARSARMVLFSSELYGGIDAAETAADTALTAWREGGCVPSSLETIADASPKDEPDSIADGRLTDSLRKNKIDHALAAWLYSDERVIGDAAAVTTDSGVCIVYYECDGEYVRGWYEEAAEVLRGRAEAAVVDGLTQRYPVESDADVIAGIAA